MPLVFRAHVPGSSPVMSGSFTNGERRRSIAMKAQRAFRQYQVEQPKPKPTSDQQNVEAELYRQHELESVPLNSDLAISKDEINALVLKKIAQLENQVKVEKMKTCAFNTIAQTPVSPARPVSLLHRRIRRLSKSKKLDARSSALIALNDDELSRKFHVLQESPDNSLSSLASRVSITSSCSSVEECPECPFPSPLSSDHSDKSYTTSLTKCPLSINNMSNVVGFD